jgi:hypothetical protein
VDLPKAIPAPEDYFFTNEQNNKYSVLEKTNDAAVSSVFVLNVFRAIIFF